MLKYLRSLSLFSFLLLLVSCGGDKSAVGPNPEDTVLVNTSEVRPDWIDELDIDEQATVIAELVEEDLEPRSTILNMDASVWGDLDAPKATVYFDLDQATVRPADFPILDSVANTLLDNPEMQVLLTGFCDWRGTTDYNLALGEKRASNVMDYLTQLGVNGANVSILSRGDLDAVVQATPDQMAQDRRVEIIITQ